MADDYLYDVFISYRREEHGANLITPWVHSVVARLRFWLSQELGGRDARVFFDVVTMEVGSPWPDRLRDGIRRSRCLVPILSPQYFQSTWCLTEWDSFIARQELVTGVSDTLIVPLKFHDGEWFPEDAQRITTLDLREHASTAPSFAQTRRFVELDELIQRFAHDVAQAVLKAPPFDATWPIRERDPVDPPRNFPMGRL